MRVYFYSNSSANKDLESKLKKDYKRCSYYTGMSWYFVSWLLCFSMYIYIYIRTLGWDFFFLDHTTRYVFH